MAPAALNELMERGRISDRKADYRTAALKAEIRNVHNNWDERPEGWSAEDFMPGSATVPRSGADAMKDFVLAWERGELDQVSEDPAYLDEFDQKLEAYIGPPTGVQLRRR